MVNSQIHINPLGNGSSEQQFIDTSFQFHDMSPQELAAFQSIAQQHGQQEHKMVDDEHMMPYVFDVAGAEAHTHRQQGNSQMTQDGNVRAERTVPLAQSVEQQQGQNMNDQGVPTHIQTDSPEEAQVARAVSQSEPNYDEFGISNPSITDANGQPVQTQKLDGKSGTPAWTELKTKAGKERKRLPLACIACRRKKIRCSGEKPACKHCLRSRIPCVYKVTARKAAPRTDYMAMLDKRLRRMEERIIKIVPKNEADVTSVVRAVAKPAIPGTAATKPAAKKRQAEEAFGSELENWAKSTKADSEGIVPASLKAQEQEENRLLVEGADALPTKDIQEHLAEVFFDNLYGQAYHVLHKPSYMRKLKGGTLPPVLILAVCAVSARFSTHPKVNSHPAFLRGDSWAAEARKIVLNRYEWPNITILTCLLLLGLHEFGTCYGGRSWALGGMAIRMAYALQLHRDLDHDPCRPNSRIQLSFVDREIRRRTMWACFLMDRFNSSGTDRPMFIKEETIQVQLPIKEKLFQLDMEGPTENLTGDVPYPAPSTDGELSDARENMGVAAYIIRSIALWGRIIIYHFQGGRDRDAHAIWEAESEFAALKKQTEEFVDSLPDELKFTQANINAHETDGLANQFMFLHITSMQNVIILHHNASTPFPSRPGRLPRPTPPAPFVADCAKTAFEAAKKMSEYLRAAEGFAVTAPFAGYCAFLSSSIQMAAAFSKDTAIAAEAKRNLATNVRYLTKVKRYWGAFHWTSEQLKNQFKACADAANRGMAAGGAGMQIMYGDWFDRYPHGVSQSDFEDPAVRVKTEKGDDAVLEHKSDLQSVEQFFRSIPPTQPGDQKGKKRKTQAAAAKAGAVGAGTLQSPSPLNQNALTTPSPTVLQNQGHPQHPTTQQQQHHLNPTAQPFTTVSHLPPYIPTTTQPFPSHLPPNQTSFFGADPSAIPAHIPFPYQLSSGILPQLDRQLVYGAYAGLEMPGLDPNAMSWNSPNNGLPGLGIGEMEWAAQMDGDGHVGGEGMNEGATGGGGLESSAWFMPFNMQPPTGMMDGSEGDAFGLGGEAYGMGMGGGMAMELGPSQQGQGGQQQGGQQGNMGQ